MSQSPQPTQTSGGNSSNGHVQSGSEYLQEVLGDVLAGALSSVARERPRDPVQYVADYLYKVQEEEKRLSSSRHRSDHDHDLRERDEEEYDKDSGLYEDQEAPSNQSNSTISTLELEEAAEAVAITQGHSKSKSRRHRSRRRHTKESRDSGFAPSGPSTSSSTDGHAQDGGGSSSSRQQGRRSRGRTKSWRRRTAQSEPANSVTSSTSVTYHDGRDRDGEEVKRSRSLQDTRPYQRNDPRRMLSKKVPAAALSGEEYRRKRGLSSQRLPPMKDSPVPSGTIKDHLDYSINGKPKHKQLQPMKGLDKFDWQKHLKKNRKMLRENQLNNLV